MNLFKKEKGLFLKKKPDAAENAGGEVQALLEMPVAVVYPDNLMESLAIAMVLDSKEAITLSVSDIKLYKIYDVKSGSFLGSFYAIERNGRYYGNIVGSTQIISCDKSAFRFEKSDEVYVPLHSDGERFYVLVCRYHAKKADLCVLRLIKLTAEDNQEEVLKKFDSDVSFDEACKECLDMLKV